MRILTKRRKFVLSSFLLSVGLFWFTRISLEAKYWAIGGLSLLAGILTFWSLKESAFYLARWMTPILPVFFTAGIGMFYFLLPSTFLAIIPVLIIYFLGMYAIFLTENIFSVSALRTINLFRSASAVGFLLTLFTSFFLNNTIISLKLFFWQNFLAVFLLSFPLCLNSLWSVNLEEKLSWDLFISSLTIAIFLGELAAIISFWPVTVTVGSIFLTGCLYVLLGLAQIYRSGRLFKKTVFEYLMVGLIVFLIMFFYTPWG